MRFSKILVLLMMMAASVATSQKKNITLEEIWSGKFSQQHLQSLQSLNNGVEYVVLDHDPDSGNSSVDVYSYKTGKKTRTLVDTKNLEGLKSFQNFSLSQDESKMLLATDPQPIYRRSSKSIFYIFDINSKKLTKLSDKKIQEPTFSPDNSKIAYVFNNNIYVYDVVENSEKQITKDGKINSIINGVTDWVYEEELGFVKAFEWNNKGDRIAFLRFDESKVPEFSMDIFGSDLYPDQQVFKYPKAGEANSDVSLHMYDVATEATQEIDLGDYSDFYIPRIKWTNKDYILSAQVLNRHQDQLDLIFINAEDHSTKVVLTEKDEAYVDVTDNLTFLEDNSFIWTSERDGYNHIYLYAENGKLKNQVTKGNWEVTNYYGYDKESNRLFYQSTENGSVNRDVYSIKTNGKGKKRLTEKTGTNNADFSTDFTYFINAFTNVETPMEYTLHLAKNGKLVREIKNNDELLEVEKPYHFSPKELSTLPVNGNELNMWIIKPSDFDESKKYPLLMFQYSGPGSQSVSNS